MPAQKTDTTARPPEIVQPCLSAQQIEMRKKFDENATHPESATRTYANEILAACDPGIAQEHPEVFCHPEIRYPAHKL